MQRTLNRDHHIKNLGKGKMEILMTDLVVVAYRDCPVSVVFTVTHRAPDQCF